MVKSEANRDRRLLWSGQSGTGHGRVPHVPMSSGKPPGHQAPSDRRLLYSTITIPSLPLARRLGQHGTVRDHCQHSSRWTVSDHRNSQHRVERRRGLARTGPGRLGLAGGRAVRTGQISTVWGRPARANVPGRKRSRRWLRRGHARRGGHGRQRLWRREGDGDGLGSGGRRGRRRRARRCGRGSWRGGRGGASLAVDHIDRVDCARSHCISAALSLVAYTTHPPKPPRAQQPPCTSPHQTTRGKR